MRSLVCLIRVFGFVGVIVGDIKSVFDSDDFISLKYSQPIRIYNGEHIIEICPVIAGRLIGGSSWIIRVGGEEILYSVDYNHTKEKVLNAPSIIGINPTLMITDAYNALIKPTYPTAEKRHTDLLCIIMWLF